jgi:hypothetical protein
MDRPALRRLMGDSQAGKVDCVVVYKVDRLSRSRVAAVVVLRGQAGPTFTRLAAGGRQPVWWDLRELAESGAGDEVIMTAIAAARYAAWASNISFRATQGWY